MSRVACRTVPLLKRTYAAVTENVKAKGQSAASMIRRVVHPSSLGEAAEGAKEQAFWMRDPKTGNWIPETHFGEVDAADLRAKFLSKKP